MKSGWRIARRNLARNRRRNMATAFAIALGYAGMVLLGGHATRIERFLRINPVYLLQTGHLAIYKTGGPERALAHREVRARRRGTAKDRRGARSRVDVEFLRRTHGHGLVGNDKTVPFIGLGVDLEREARVLRHREVLAACPSSWCPCAASSSRLRKRSGRNRLRGSCGHIVETRVHDRSQHIDARAGAGLLGRKREGRDRGRRNVGCGAWSDHRDVDGEVVNLFHTALVGTRTTRSSARDCSRFGKRTRTNIAVFLANARDIAPRGRARGSLRDAGLDVPCIPSKTSASRPLRRHRSVLTRSGFIGSWCSPSSSYRSRMPDTDAPRANARNGSFRALGFTRDSSHLLFASRSSSPACLGSGTHRQSRDRCDRQPREHCFTPPASRARLHFSSPNAVLCSLSPGSRSAPPSQRPRGYRARESRRHLGLVGCVRRATSRRGGFEGAVRAGEGLPIASRGRPPMRPVIGSPSFRTPRVRARSVWGFVQDLLVRRWARTRLRRCSGLRSHTSHSPRRSSSSSCEAFTTGAGGPVVAVPALVILALMFSASLH